MANTTTSRSTTTTITTMRSTTTMIRTTIIDDIFTTDDQTYHHPPPWRPDSPRPRRRSTTERRSHGQDVEKKVIPKDLKKQEQEVMSESSNSEDKALELALRPWSDLPAELLEPISSRLFLADHIRFPAVCKNWQAISIPRNCTVEPPWFASLSKDDGVCSLFDASCGRTYRVNSSKLVGASILSSKFGWLLLAKRDHNITSLFFFNPLRGDTIHLPPLELVHSSVATFSAPPSSSDCLVCVIDSASPNLHNSFDIYTHKEGQFAEWLRYRRAGFHRFLLQPHAPVVCNGRIYCAGLGGKVGIFNPETTAWMVFDNLMVSTSEYRINFVAECEGEVLLVSVPAPNKPIQVLKVDQPPGRIVEVGNLEGKALFVSPKAAMLTRVGAERMGNKIHYPVFGSPCQCDRIGHYSMDAREYHPSMEFSLPMEISKFLVGGSNSSWAWMEPTP